MADRCSSSAIVVEVTTYRLIAELVSRDRPDVVKLDNLNPAPQLSVGARRRFCRRLLRDCAVGDPRFHQTWLRMVIWTAVPSIPFLVAVSRIYRGEHHVWCGCPRRRTARRRCSLSLCLRHEPGSWQTSGARLGSRRGGVRFPLSRSLPTRARTTEAVFLELRRILQREGISDPIWHEVPKSREAPERTTGDRGGRRPGLRLGRGRDGARVRGRPREHEGDAGSRACRHGKPLRSEPGNPTRHSRVVASVLGCHKKFDIGRMNGEAFAVFAGAGFDALMVHDASRKVKSRIGRAAYLWSGAKNLRKPSRRRSTSMVSAGTRGKQAASSSATCARSRVGLRVVRRRPLRRRHPRPWCRDCRESDRLDADARPHCARPGTAVAVRAGHKGPFGQDQVELQGALRADGGASGQEEDPQRRGRARAVTVCVPESATQGRYPLILSSDHRRFRPSEPGTGRRLERLARPGRHSPRSRRRGPGQLRPLRLCEPQDRLRLVLGLRDGHARRARSVQPPRSWAARSTARSRGERPLGVDGPRRNLLIQTDEDFDPTPSPEAETGWGYSHIYDVSDKANPVELSTLKLPSTTQFPPPGPGRLHHPTRRSRATRCTRPGTRRAW